MISKFPGRCATCKQSFPAGAEINYDQRTRTASHKNCNGEQPDGTLVIGKAETPLERDLRRSVMVAQAEKRAGTNGHQDSAAPAHNRRETAPYGVPASDSTLDAELLRETCTLLDVYSEACRHADQLGIPPAVVRTLMLSAYIGSNQRKGRPR